MSTFVYIHISCNSSVWLLVYLSPPTSVELRAVRLRLPLVRRWGEDTSLEGERTYYFLVRKDSHVSEDQISFTCLRVIPLKIAIWNPKQRSMEISCERSEATFVYRRGGTGLTDFGRLPIYVLCPRHFFINGSKTLAMRELKYSEHFCPKKIRVSWLCTSNFGIGVYISVFLILALLCCVPILFLSSFLSCCIQR